MINIKCRNCDQYLEIDIDGCDFITTNDLPIAVICPNIDCGSVTIIEIVIRDTFTFKGIKGKEA